MERMKQWPVGKIAAAVVWGLGAFMTMKAFEQATDWNAGTTLVVALGIQFVLTYAQSPVWAGRGNVISYALLLADAVINFGGVNAVMVNIDQVGSVQAVAALFGFYGPWPMWVKGGVALGVSALIAGLPEYLWKREG